MSSLQFSVQIPKRLDEKHTNSLSANNNNKNIDDESQTRKYRRHSRTRKVDAPARVCVCDTMASHEPLNRITLNERFPIGSSINPINPINPSDDAGRRRRTRHFVTTLKKEGQGKHNHVCGESVETRE